MSTQARPVTLQYATRSDLLATESKIALSTDEARGNVGVRGVLQDPALWREALMTVFGIYGSDLRHKSRDRSAYLAYLAKQGKKATAAIWEAQKAFLDESFTADTVQNTILDPIVTVHPDEVSIEVFSRDESTYARLALSNALLSERQASHGTACLDLSPRMIDGLERLKTYQPVSLDLGAQVPTSGAREAKEVQLSPQWLRGFLQVQTAATLPAVSCEFAPIDLYNLLFALRTRKAKNPPRALRIELVPGAKPRMVIEPWELVLEGHGPIYTGKTPRVVRTFGRQRLMAFARVLPFLKSARVFLNGQGLPFFWVLDLGLASLTLGLTGWTESGWASAASFDALMPAAGVEALADQAEKLLSERGPQSHEQLTEGLKTSSEKARDAMKVLCLRGRALYDLARAVYRPRHLFAQAISDAEMRFGSPQEAQAHRYLEEKGVTLTKIHEIAGEGVEIAGEVKDKESKRTYRVRFTLDAENRIRDVYSDDPMFKRTGLREGPSAPLLALRLFFARQRAEAEAQRQTPEGRKLIRAETRTLLRRDAQGREVVYRVSLDDRLVRVSWGARSDAPRQQRLWFDSDREAREAYFSRLENLAAEGFIDADAAAN
jgi:hypothetical protein